MNVRRVFVIVFVLVLLYKPVRPTLDWDMGWHLQTGEYILDHGLPRQDVFSFTVPGRDWITHEWLSEVFMAATYRLGGLAALILAFAGVSALTFWLVYVRCVGQPYLAAFITLLGAFTSSFTWGVRPQMFNILGLAAFLNIVEGVKEKSLGRRAFLLLPVLTVIWANLHSGYLVGVVLLGVYVVGEAAQRRFGSPDERGLNWVDIRWLAGTTVLCFGVALLNPSGYRLWVYPFETLTSNAMQTYIQEWHSPDFHSPRFWLFGVMLMIGLVSIAPTHKRPSWTDILLFFGTAIAGLISARHIPIFAVVSVSIVTRHLLPKFADTRSYPLLAGTRPPPQPTAPMIVLHWLAVGLLALLAVVAISRTIQQNGAAIAASFPVEAVDFMEEQGWLDRRIYNSYNWGGYLIWRGVPVFVDGRADLYGDEFMLYYLQTLLIRSDWREPLDDFKADYVLIGPATPLSILLMESVDWREAYRDDVAQVFERATK